MRPQRSCAWIACLAAPLLAAAAGAQPAGSIAAPGECAAPPPELDMQPRARSGGDPPSEEPPGGVGGSPGALFEAPGGSGGLLSVSGAASPTSLFTPASLDSLPAVDSGLPSALSDPLDPLPLGEALSGVGDALLGEDG